MTQADKTPPDAPASPKLGIPRSGMDVPRHRRGKLRRWLLPAAGLLAAAAAVVLLARIDASAPVVERDTVVVATVERGPMLRTVHGSGTLVPTRVRYISAMVAGRVEEVRVQPGEAVQADTVILKLSNPDVMLEALAAEQRVTEAQAALVEMRRTLQQQILAQESELATAQADHQDAKRRAEADAELVGQSRISRIEALRSQDREAALATKLSVAQKQLALLRKTVQQELAVQAQQVERLGSIYEHHQRRVASMEVLAGIDGVVQGLELQPGQWVQSGTTLARVVEPGSLEAELRIGQLQARDVQPGQRAIIDLRTETIEGEVIRVDPNVQDGFVPVRVGLRGELPQGTRADLNVEGTVVLEELDRVLHVERPAHGQSNSTIKIFKLKDDGAAAEQIMVRLGRASVSEVEILGGLDEGAQIIVSDMSRWDDTDRIRLQ